MWVLLHWSSAYAHIRRIRQSVRRARTDSCTQHPATTPCTATHPYRRSPAHFATAMAGGATHPEGCTDTATPPTPQTACAGSASADSHSRSVADPRNAVRPTHPKHTKKTYLKQHPEHTGSDNSFDSFILVLLLWIC